MNYLVIDLEMCKVPKDYRNKNYKYASELFRLERFSLMNDTEDGMRSAYMFILNME